MYYDTLYYKMIPGIIIIVNNKTLNGYLEIFNYIEHSILNKIENKLERFKWQTFTSDFEIALYEEFGRTFQFINNFKYIRCFFHFLMNIRKILIQNGLGTNNNKDYYDYIITEIYDLLFKKILKKI